MSKRLLGDLREEKTRGKRDRRERERKKRKPRRKRKKRIVVDKAPKFFCKILTRDYPANPLQKTKVLAV